MTLGGEIASALPGLRAEAEAMMRSSVKIGSRTETTDPNTLATVIVWDPMTYTGPARIRFVSQGLADVDAGGQVVAIQNAVLSLPIDGSGAVFTDQVVEVTANPADSDLAGKLFRISGYHGQTDSTARRFPLEVIS